jgi:predicted heme/steroid binding protein
MRLVMLSVLTYGLVLGLPLLFLLLRYSLSPSPQSPQVDSQPEEKKSLKTIMQPPRDDLEPPKDNPFTLEQLKEFDGSDPSKPIYVSITGASSCMVITAAHLFAGTVFDVTRKSDVYGPGKAYNIFAGKDGSKGLGMSSLNLEDAVPDYSGLPENERKVLADWFSFFQYVPELPPIRPTCLSALIVISDNIGNATTSLDALRICLPQLLVSLIYSFSFKLYLRPIISVIIVVSNALYPSHLDRFSQFFLLLHEYPF